MDSCMVIVLVLAIGIPAVIVLTYYIGNQLYGEKWYRILGASATDEKLAEEIEEARITKLNIN